MSQRCISPPCERETAPQLFEIGSIRLKRRCGNQRGNSLEELLRSELDAALARPRYGRGMKAGHEGTPRYGHRHGSQPRSLTGSFGSIKIAVPRARLDTRDGGRPNGRANCCGLARIASALPK
ncbi:bll1963 [Bradyrhizobium diazoefficiens USDA 110]|uniref:Bll1963 protein n=2 Tax=Bradyrhizobium TaxID=374 RepID=H7C6M4_BRADU|nr:ID565 [Bradyrhizobium japonicum]AND87527.1 hypothetical protein AAV28_06685 [Bradyrhizobium diazoefficiens USDA 110]APO50596.1 hypothetical protein BD122_10090 [Bradyrhizobium diazoefficiens]BAL13129.1 hypothetical protein BJ6T_78830 [Bradyrhizobium japonicum USDA 6]AJA65483.1 hypothetical protein RN69_38265 [Bradyrhizobium japonicum]